MAPTFLKLIVSGFVIQCIYGARLYKSSRKINSTRVRSGSSDPLDIGNTVRIFSKNFGNECVRHKNYGLQINVMNTSDQQLMNDSAFVVRAGLAGGSSISFEAVNKPSHYVRHKSSRVQIDRYQSGSLFRQDASWYVRSPRDPYQSTGMVSFESYNYPGRFFRHEDGWLIWSHSQGSDSRWPEDATWKVEFADDRVVTMEVGALLRAASTHDNATLNYTKSLHFGHTHTEETNQEFYVKAEAEAEGMIRLWSARVKAETGYTYSSGRSFNFDRSYNETVQFVANPGSDAYVYQLFMDATTANGKPLEWLGPVVLTGVPLPTVVRWPADFQ